MEQPEIFGRFVLLDVVDDGPDRPRTFRGLDLSRELQPVVAVRRAGPTRQAPSAQEQAVLAWHADMDVAGIAELIERGVLDGWSWSARTWVPGVSLDVLLTDADGRGEPLPLSLSLSLAYILANVVAEGITSPGRPSSATLQPRPRRIVVGGDGRVRLLGPILRGGPVHEEAVGADGADMPTLATTIMNLCTVGGGEVPAELRRKLDRARSNGLVASELASALRPLMDAAGGGSYSGVATAVRGRLADAFAADESRREKDLQLARRLRERRRRSRPPKEGLDMIRLRIRPASQEGPARLERVEAVPEGMVLVSGGRFLFSQGDDVMDYVDVRPFFVDRMPITWGGYAAFCEATRHPAPSSWPEPLRTTPSLALVPPEHLRSPVTGISHDDADAFARAHGKRLLSEVEWELAARGFDGRPFPWGYDFDIDKAGERWRTASTGPIADAELEVTSPFGLSLLGHAWEWTSTPAGDLADTSWVVRGGPWRNRREPPTLLNRSHELQAAADVTFRCARNLVGDVAATWKADGVVVASMELAPAMRPARVREDDTDEGDPLSLEDDTDEERAT